MPLTIHLGAHKTATTHLQDCLAEATGDLRAVGVGYIGRMSIRRGAFPLLSLLGSREDRRGSGGQMDAHIRTLTATCPEILLSDENMLGPVDRRRLYGAEGRVYPHAGRRLKRTLKHMVAGPVTLALSIRDPASFNTSMFGYLAGRGNELSWSDYIDGRDPTVTRWADLVERLLAVPEVARVIVWRYEDYRTSRNKILSAMLPKAVIPKIPDLPPVNLSLSQPALHWLQEEAMRRHEVDLRYLHAQAVALFPKDGGHAPLQPMGEGDLARSQANYATEVDTIRKLPRVTFIDP